MTDKPRIGRPPHEPTDATRAQVETMIGYGVPEKAIAETIGISDVTLRKHYRDEIDTGTAKANAKVAESLYKKALGDKNGSVTAAIFWMKTRAGWKETVKNEFTGEDGGPIQTEDVSAREFLLSRIDSLAARAGENSGD